MEKRLWCTYGGDWQRMAEQVLEAAELTAHIGDKDARIGIKPNLVNATPASHGATTHPELVAGIIAYLQRNGFTNLTILEGSWVGASTKQAFDACGYRALSKATGVPLHDTKEDRGVSVDCAGMHLSLCESAMVLDFLINVPVVKGHCQTELTCALKNLKGLIPDAEKRRFHTMGLMKPIAHLNLGIRTGFVLADGICGDLDFEEGGNPVRREVVVGCYDPVLLDAWAAESLGYAPADIGYIPIAQRLGVGEMDLSGAETVALRSPTQAAGTPKATGRAQKLAGHGVQARDACSTCYSNLIYALQRMQDRGTLRRLQGPVCIGQGYAGQSAEGNGIGKCTAGCPRSLAGCPPSAARIVAFLEEQE